MTREEAIKIIRETYHTDEEMKALESLIPELRESEDERIRKWLIELVQNTDTNHNNMKLSENCKLALAWIEKHKEQKPTGWSEDDKKKFHFLSRLIEFQVKDGEYCFDEGSCAISKQEAIEMLQSLRPSWKPSEEQMSYLSKAIKTLGEEGNCKTAAILNEIRLKLEKL